ncbi:lipopolysaccharide biosynthesis protein [Affinirhizobium pseudoryzae]|uniref:lipopolysaccharide biosynthesis protein n=1 Tax=Allorhizobium pseudoryzae TaxID=379684 RepID=UPI0013EE0E0A|nr:lipopolysaccharide biosynthesis protein [Allorhizobium pseudoryzae]
MSAETPVRSEFDPDQTSYRRSVQAGAIVTGSSQAVVALCQIVSVIVLSRLLSPSDFGIVAMSWPVIGLLSIFQDFGLTQATVQRPGITRQDVNFLFWLNVGISGLVALAIFATAPLAAAFYSEPKIAALLMAMSCLVLIQGLGAQHTALLNRRMRFPALSAMEVAGALGGLGTSVTWALLSPSYWALFGGSLVTVLLPVILAWTLSGWRPGLPRRAEGARALVNFGAGLTGFNLANFVARNADNVLIGRFLGGAQLGLYDRAYKLMLMPLRQATNPLARVMVPTLARLSDEPARYRQAYLTVVPLLLIALVPGIAALIIVAPTFIPFLLGPEWQESALIFSALGFAGLLQPLNNPAGWLFISQGRSRDFMIWGVVTATTSVAAFVIGLPYGVYGVAVCYTISEYLRTPFLWWFIGRKGPVRVRDMLSAAGPTLIGAHLAIGGFFWLDPALPGNPIAQAAIAASLTYSVSILIALIFPSGRDAARNLLGMIPRRLQRKSS